MYIDSSHSSNFYGGDYSMNDVIVSNPQLEPIINLDNALRIRIYILFTSVLCIFRNRYSGSVFLE